MVRKAERGEPRFVAAPLGLSAVCQRPKDRASAGGRAVSVCFTPTTSSGETASRSRASVPLKIPSRVTGATSGAVEGRGVRLPEFVLRGELLVTGCDAQAGGGFEAFEVRLAAGTAGPGDGRAAILG